MESSEEVAFPKTSGWMVDCKGETPRVRKRRKPVSSKDAYSSHVAEFAE